MTHQGRDANAKFVDVSYTTMRGSTFDGAFVSAERAVFPKAKRP